MIKRIFFLFCAVVMVVAMLAVPAFATEVHEESVKILKQPVDVVQTRNYQFTFSVEVSGDYELISWQYSEDNGLTWKNSGVDGLTYSGSGISSWSGRLYRAAIYLFDGTVVYSDPAHLYFNTIPFSFSVKQSISFVLKWVGIVVNSLISSDGFLHPLLPILAIGIAVTAVLLVTKIFKSFSWGL